MKKLSVLETPAKDLQKASVRQKKFHITNMDYRNFCAEVSIKVSTGLMTPTAANATINAFSQILKLQDIELKVARATGKKPTRVFDV